MYIPESFGAACVLMVISMICWGSWANAFSLTRGKYRFELFFWDYTIGVLLAAIVAAAILAPQSGLFHGTLNPSKVAWGLASGAVFSIGTVLLVGSISLIGMSVAFPVCVGLAMLIGGTVSWFIEAAVPAVPMAIGLGLILLSVILDAAAYRAKSTETAARPSTRGLVIAILGGLFTGAFAPCLQQAMVGETKLDPYAGVVMLAVGIFLCAVLTNYGFMQKPIAGGEPMGMGQYFKAPLGYHALGIAGGIVWGSGAVFNFVAGGKVSVAISYAFGGGATLVTAFWGIFLWKEFKGAPKRSYWYLCGMAISFLLGVAVIAWAKSSMPTV